MFNFIRTCIFVSILSSFAICHGAKIPKNEVSFEADGGTLVFKGNYDPTDTPHVTHIQTKEPMPIEKYRNARAATIRATTRALEKSPVSKKKSMWSYITHLVGLEDPINDSLHCPRLFIHQHKNRLKNNLRLINTLNKDLIGHTEFSPDGHLSLLKISPSYIKYGHGTSLFNKTKELMKDSGAKKMTWVAYPFASYSPSQEKLNEFYEKLGGKRIHPFNAFEMDLLPPVQLPTPEPHNPFAE